MSSFSATAFSSSAFSSEAFSLGNVISAGAAWDSDNSLITNAQATSVVPENYEICQRTGFKQLPMWHPLSQFTQDGYGEYVRAKSADDRHPQDFVRARGNDAVEGPQNPEADNVFLSSTISPEML